MHRVRAHDVGDAGVEAVVAVTVSPEVIRSRSRIASRSRALTMITKTMLRPKRFAGGADADGGGTEIETIWLASRCRIDRPAVVVVMTPNSRLLTTTIVRVPVAHVAIAPGATTKRVTGRVDAAASPPGSKP